MAPKRFGEEKKREREWSEEPTRRQFRMIFHICFKFAISAKEELFENIHKNLSYLTIYMII